MTLEQRKRVWASTLVALGLYIVGLFTLVDLSYLGPQAIIGGAAAAAFFGWRIGMAMTGVDMIVTEWRNR